MKATPFSGDENAITLARLTNFGRDRPMACASADAISPSPLSHGETATVREVYVEGKFQAEISDEHGRHPPYRRGVDSR